MQPAARPRDEVRRWMAARPAPVRWDRGDLAVAAAAAVLVLLRWPWRAEYLMTWDAHTFALALERYDVNALRPHAPGYPVFVALAWVVNRVVPDHNDAYIALGLLFGAAAAVLLYALGRRLLGRPAALAATALLLATPLLHGHVSTANVYTADLACSLAVAATAWWARQRRSPRRLAALAAVFGLAVGIRQSQAIFFLPLVAWAALGPPWSLREQARRLLPPAAVGAAVGLAWFLPMAWLSGGLATWRRANALQSDVVYEHPVWRDPWMLQVNAERLAGYLHWELRHLLPATVLLLAAGAGAAWWHARDRRTDREPLGRDPLDRRLPWFLALWGLPAFAFYLTVYSGYGNGPSGYALILLPPLLLACALLGQRALRRLVGDARVQAAAAAALVATVAALDLGHLRGLEDVDYREHDAWVANWLGLPEAFPAHNTSIVTAYNFAHVWYYYPDYQVFEYRPPGKAVGEVPDFLLVQEARHHEAVPDWYDEIADRDTPGPHRFHDGVETLVLFDFQLAGENGGERQLRPGVPHHEAWLPNGWRILYVEVTPEQRHLEDYFTMEGAL